jgi:hypothetical protein
MSVTRLFGLLLAAAVASASVEQSFRPLAPARVAASSVAAAAPPTYLPIADGVPVSGSVGAQQTAFYRFVAPLPFPRMDVVVTPLFGQPDLYVTAGRFYDPSPGDSEWRSSSLFGDDVVTIPANATFADLGRTCDATQANVTTCWVNVGVYGARAANFSLVLVTRTGGAPGAEALLPGVPAVGSVPSGAVDVYNFTVAQWGPTPPTTVTFRLSPAGGAGAGAAPSLYLASTAPAAGAPRPDPSNPASYCASATDPPGTSGVMSLSLIPSSPCACAAGSPSCTFFISVAGAPAASSPSSPAAPSSAYTLVATTSAVAYTELVDGSPQGATGAQGLPGVQFLLDAQLATASGRVEVTVTPLFGTVQLYVALAPAGSASPLPPGPASGAPFASSGGPGPQSLSLSPGDPRWAAACGASGTGSAGAAPCSVYIGVWTTSTASTFTVVARAAAYLALTSGLPQSDSLPSGAGSVALFRFLVAAPGQSLSISVAATEGDPSLFVGCDSNNATIAPDGTPGSFLWSSVSTADETVVIAPSDPLTCLPPCSYYIGVVSATPSRGIGFTVLARTNTTGAPTPLVLGEVVLDAVAPGDVVYYTLPFPASAPSLTVSVFVVNGNVALLGRLDNTTLTQATAEYSVQPQGSGEWEGFTSAVGDAAWNSTPTCAGAAGSSTAAPCTLSLAVLGSTTTSSSQYLITASADVLQLIDGVEVPGRVAQTPAITYFRYTAADRAPFTVTLTTLTGDPDLIMAVGTRPNASFSQWSSRTPAGEFISVQWTELWLVGATFPADFYIGVSGWDDSCAFTIVASSNPYTELASGVPQSAESKAGVLSYFLFNVPAADALGFAVGFAVSLTPTSGDSSPLLFLNTVNHTGSCAHCGWPYCTTTPCSSADSVTAYNRDWSSLYSPTPLLVEVDTMNPYYETNTQYIIAVLSSVDSEFTLTATYSSGAATLLNQVPMLGSASAQTGAGTFYVLDILNIDVDLSIALTPIAGIADVFVSVNSSNRRPSALAYDRSALGGSGEAEVVLFSWADLPECPNSSVADTIVCYVYIGVFARPGGDNATYSIVADAAKPNQTAIMLVDGVPSVGVVRPADYNLYYTLINLPPTAVFSVTLNPYGTAKLDLYVTLDGSRPSPTNYQFASAKTNGPEQVTIAPGMPGYNSTTILRAAVHAPFQGWYGYDVTYEAAALTSLQPGTPSIGTVQVPQTRFYSLPIPSPALSDGLDFAYTGISGLHPIFMLGLQPPGNLTWRPAPGDPSTCVVRQLGGGSSPTGSTVIHIATTNPCFCPAGSASCTYVAAVSCTGIPYWNPSCQYVVEATVRSSQPVQLTDGVPLYHQTPGAGTPGAAPYGRLRLFTLDVTQMLVAGANVTFSANVADGGGGGQQNVQLFVTNMIGGVPTPGGVIAPGGPAAPSPPPPQQQQGTGFWSSNATGPVGTSASLTLSSSDPAIVACPSCTLLTVGVFGSGGSLGSTIPFYVSGTTTTGTPTRLTLGAPSAPVTANYKDVHSFVVYLASAAHDLIIDTTIFQGRAAVTVDPFDPNTACSVGRPPQRVIQCSGLWASTTAQPLRIRASDPCANANSSLPVPCDPTTAFRAGYYFVSVLVYWSPTTYILTATQPGLVVALEDGQPQQAAASSDVPAFFSYAVPSSALPLAENAPVRVVLTAPTTLALTYFIASCAAPSGSPSFTGCPNSTVFPGPATPGPGVVTGTVPGSSTAAVVLSPGTPGFCDVFESGPGGACLYFIGVYPPAGCDPATCAAQLTVVAELQTGTAPVQVPWASVAGQVAEVDGVVAPPPPPPSPSAASPEQPPSFSSSSSLPPPSTPVELYLSPFDTGSSVGLQLTLEACGPADPAAGGSGLPSLYLCDPTIAAPLGCANPFAPGPAPGASTSSLTTLGSASGRVSMALPQTSASILYMTVADASASGSETGSVSLPVGGSTFRLLLSALSGVYYLAAGGTSAAVAADVTAATPPTASGSPATLSVTLSWQPATAVTLDGTAPALAASGVVYTVYVAPDSFGPAYVPGTACGLGAWGSAAATPAGGSIVTSTVPQITLTGLQSATGLWQFGVVATCDAGCWGSTGVTPPPSGSGSSSLTTQNIAYAVLTVNATAGGGGGGAEAAAISATTAGIIAGAVLAVLGGAAGFFVVRRRRWGGGGPGYASVPGDAGLLVIPADEAAATAARAGGSGRTSPASLLPGRETRVAHLRGSLATPVSLNRGEDGGEMGGQADISHAPPPLLIPCADPRRRLQSTALPSPVCSGRGCGLCAADVASPPCPHREGGVARDAAPARRRAQREVRDECIRTLRMDPPWDHIRRRRTGVRCGVGPHPLLPHCPLCTHFLFLRVINMSLRSLAVAMAATAVVARNNLARTPPMGW